MGRIKSTMVKRAAKQLQKEMPDTFSQDFDHNKKALGNTMPSKSVRNKIAGYLSRMERAKVQETKKTSSE